ncbi:MAG: hypothetical protein A2Y38_00205 [Spirochaetes bacterium GWB1_59_5]|nr:MAG: hypothetical protein A2Y38_00205 [Spirochaetes bacterium GWB1_59_5]
MIQRLLRKARIFLPQWMNDLFLDNDHRRLHSRLLAGSGLEHSFIPVDVSVPCAFVLLQYNQANMTIECIEAIEKLDSLIPVKIVVVDNGSKDDSLLKIRAYSDNKTSIHVLASKENTGYARGNNQGYRFAKEVLKSQFIFILNNDVIIEDKRFLQKAMRLYGKTSYSILGPDIVVRGKRDVHQNPLGYSLKTGADMQRSIARDEKKLEDIDRDTTEGMPPKPYGHKIKDRYRRHGSIVLHGAAYMFSPIFVNDFEYPFDERTFLYGEENLLSLRALSRKHALFYCPSIQVVHKTKTSTETTDLRAYRKFRYANNIKSCRIYLEVLSTLNGRG